MPFGSRSLFALAAVTSLIAAPVRFARVGDLRGTVEVQLRAGEPFQPAVRNTPLPQGARVRTVDGRLEAELDDGSVLRLTGTALAELSDCAMLSDGQRITSLSIDEGTVYFTGRPRDNDALSLSVPGAQLTLRRRARVRLDIAANWTDIAILEGRVRFATPSAELELREGQLARVPQSKSSAFQLFREIPVADSDEWSRKRDLAQEGSPSVPHLPLGIRFGAVDLDSWGSWLQTENAGLVWKPRIAEGWIPFHNGVWRWYPEVGYTWIASEDWGWSPYHYGRWLQHHTLGWVWAPGVSSVFKPGEVYWMRSPGLALWGPLAPGERWSGREHARQYAALNTSAAPFDSGQREITTPTVFDKPKNILQTSFFTEALPSPPFAAAGLEDVNTPLHSAASSLLTIGSPPEVRVAGASFEHKPAAVPPATVAQIPARTVVVEKPVYVEVPEPVEVYYPVPVYSGFIVLNPVISDGRQPKKKDGSSRTNGR